MSDMFDYLDWRGDIRFSQLPVNPVDGLIFSALSYIDFSDIVPESPDETVSLSVAAERFLALPEQAGRFRVRRDLTLLKAAAGTDRFREVQMCFYRAELSQEEESQFAAVTFLPGDGGLPCIPGHGLYAGWLERGLQYELPAGNSGPAKSAGIPADVCCPK